MAGSYTATTQAIQSSLTNRLGSLGFAISGSHLNAIVADMLKICVDNSVNVVSHTATDNAILKPPPLTRF